MLAIDTNLVVRYLVADDALQAQAAKTLIDTETVFVPTTVILETEWVLRDVYGFSPALVMKALRAFVGLPHVEMQDAGAVIQALDWLAGGIDFADALHLASADGCESFVTFDKAFVKVAKGISGPRVRAP